MTCEYGGALGGTRTPNLLTGQMKGTHTHGQIRSESPGIADPDPGGSPPRPPGTTLTDP
jgi:hypothetical protein